MGQQDGGLECQSPSSQLQYVKHLDGIIDSDYLDLAGINDSNFVELGL